MQTEYAEIKIRIKHSNDEAKIKAIEDFYMVLGGVIEDMMTEAEIRDFIQNLNLEADDV